MSARSSTRVMSVDGLRGLLAAFVMLAHLLNAAGSGRLIPFANLCVMGFFVISGYVLTRGWRGAYAGFLVRRFVRLWPLFALCLGVGSWLSTPAPLSNYVWYPFMGVLHQAPQDPVTWSLFVEAWAMPFMPLIIWIGRRPRVMFPVLVALVLARVWSQDLYYGVFFIIGSHFADKSVLSSRALDSAPVQWLGRISYSLYLSHVLLIGMLKFHLPGLWIYLAVPCCLAVALALCVLVEQPSIALSRRAGQWVERALGARTRLAPA
jgi:peptidoglycan/LPS O-acetylase OafA/YrhL